MLNKLKAGAVVLPVFLILLLTNTKAGSRIFDAEKMEAYKSDAAFDYININPQGLSLWDQLRMWIYGLIAQLFGNPNSGRINDILFNLFLLAIIAGVIFLFVRMQFGSAFSRSDASFNNSGFYGYSGPNKIDYQLLIQEAIANKDLKLAIRYLYQKTLASLSDQQHIALRTWKTGADYAEELKAEYRPPFAKLRQVFEYTWYGEFEPDEGDLNLCKQLSEQLESGK